MIKVDDIIDNKNNIGKSVYRATFSFFPLQSVVVCRSSPFAVAALVAVKTAAAAFATLFIHKTYAVSTCIMCEYMLIIMYDKGRL